MTASENHDAAASAKGPRHFFQNQLFGEQPLSFETANRLYELSMAVLSIKPWEFVEDEELILTQDAESGEICYCSILGALGVIFSVQVYVVAESYRFFRKIVSGEPISPGDLYASVSGVAVEFVTAKGQTPSDRELLEGIGHPKKRGRRAPIFRAFRPGYHPWYITESEGRILVRCLEAVLAFCSHPEVIDDIDFWEEEDLFPFLLRDPEDETRKNFEIHPVKAPESPAATPKPTELDEDSIARILHENLARRGVMEIDHIFTVGEIGKRDERKACLRLAMVTDGISGFAFKPEVGGPQDSTGELLIRSLLGAMRDARCVPNEVRVRKKEFKILLSTLSERLGFDLRITKSLPTLDILKEHFLATIGDPGEFSPP